MGYMNDLLKTTYENELLKEKLRLYKIVIFILGISNIVQAIVSLIF